MSLSPAIPELILFQQLTAATLLKVRNESAVAVSGGGARDLRLSPHESFQPFMERLLPLTRTTSRPGGGEVTIQFDTVTWGDGTQSLEVAYWPPTSARPREGRIARISSLPPLQDPPQDLDGAVVLFVRDRNDILWVRYASEDGLRHSMPEVGQVIEECIASSGNGRIATGFIDLRVGGLGNWCNSLSEGED